MKIRRNQIAVYWAPVRQDGFGNCVYATPVEISVRWETKSELFVDKAGNETLSKAIVYPAQTPKLEGRLWLGRIADLQSDNSPIAVHALEIKSINISPNIKGTDALVKVWL